MLELRPTTFATPPLSKGWGHQPWTTEQLKIDLTLETRLVSTLISLYCKLFNKLLVTQYTTINFGPSTQVNISTSRCLLKWFVFFRQNEGLIEVCL
jgi:hypothetical protein